MATTNDGTGIKRGYDTDDVLGSMKNRDLIRDTYVGPVAKGAKIEKGMLCYYDNGWKPTPESRTNGATIVNRGRCRVAENDADNTDGEKGDKIVTTWCGGVMIVVKVGEVSKQASQNVIVPLRGGYEFMSGVDGTISPLGAAQAAVADIKRLGIVLGKVGTIDEHDVEAYSSNLAKGDRVLVRMY